MKPVSSFFSRYIQHTTGISPKSTLCSISRTLPHSLKTVVVMLVLMVTAVVGGNGEVRAQVTQLWNFSVTGANQQTSGDYDKSGIAVSNDGASVYRATRLATSVGVFKATDGSFVKHLTSLTGFTPTYGGDVAVDSKGAIYACNAIISETGELIVAKWASESASPTKFISTTTHGGSNTKRIGYGMDVFIDSIGNGFILMHRNTTNELLYWEISNNEPKTQNPEVVTITGSPTAITDSYARISIIDKDHFWLDGNVLRPNYCVITRTGSTYSKPSSINGTQLGWRSDMIVGVGGATEFTLNGKRYGVFAANNHGTSFTNGHYVFLQEMTTGVTFVGDVIGVLPTAGLGKTSDASHFVEPVVHVDAPNNTAYIYVMGGFNGTAAFKFTNKRTFTVTVPEGTENVYIAGSFPGKNWDTSSGAYKLTQDPTNPRKFSTTIACLSNIEYKYLCNNTGDWDYQEASISNGNLTSNPNRTYNTSDVVTHWFASPKVTLNVSFASGVNTPDNLFVKGDWDSWAAGKAMTKSGDTYAITINQKTYANTKYKYYTNDPSNDNWEANADNSDRDNRWAISPTMNDQIVKFKTDIQAKVAIPTFSPAPGTYDEINSLELTVSSTTSGAAFRYTTNGTNPTTSSPIADNGKITLTPGTYTVKVLAVKDGMKNSDIASASYAVVAPILRSKTFSVTVPQGTENVYITGSFPSKNWDKGETAYKLTRQGTSNTFTGTFSCYNSLEYKYLCHNAGDDWDYQEAATDSEGNLLIAENGKPKERANRFYAENDVVLYWVAMPKFTTSVTVSSTEDTEKLFINGNWTKLGDGTWTYEKELTKTAARTFTLTIDDRKTYSNTVYKYMTDVPSKPNWESNADGTDISNRWTIHPHMNDEIAGFGTAIPAKTPPTIAPSTQIHNEASVEITITATVGDDIYYTVDGSDPKTSGSKIKYSEPFTIHTGNTLVWAYAEKNFKKSLDIYKQFAVSPQPSGSELWNQSVQKNTKRSDGDYDYCGIAISLDGQYVFRQKKASANNQTDGALGVFKVSDGSKVKDIALGFNNFRGGDVVVSPRGYVYASAATEWYNKEMTIKRIIDPSGSSPTVTTILTLPESDWYNGSHKLGFSFGVWEWQEGPSWKGYIIVHKTNSNIVHFWKLDNSAVVANSYQALSVNLPVGQHALNENFARISIINKDHFWINGNASSSVNDPYKYTPIYCEISWANSTTPNSISGNRMPARYDLNELVGGATHFEYKGKKYGVFAANNHDNGGIWIGMPKHYSMLQEYKSTDSMHNPTGPVIALFPPNGLGGATDDIQFVSSAVRVLENKVVIVTLGGVNGSACYEFKEATVNSNFTPIGTALHFAQPTKTLDLSVDYGLTEGATAYYTRSVGLSSNPGVATTASTLYNATDKLQFEEGIHKVNLLVTKPGYLSTSHSSTINVGPFVWKGNDTNWEKAADWTINDLYSAVPTYLHSVRIPTLPSGGKFPTVNGASVQVGSVEIQTGASVTLAEGKNLTIHQNLINDGNVYIGVERTLTAKTVTNNGAIHIGEGDLVINSEGGSLTNNGTIFTRKNLPDNISTFGGTVNLNGYMDRPIPEGTPKQIIPVKTYNNLILSAGQGVKTAQGNALAVVNNDMTIDTNSSLLIELNSGVKVAGSISNPNGIHGIHVKADANEPTGTLLFGNAANNPLTATVEMYSPAAITTKADGSPQYHWQFFGIPFKQMNELEHTFYGVYIRRHNEAGWGTTQLPITNRKWIQLNNQDVLKPVVGYEITQQNAKKYTFTGELFNASIDTILTYTPSVENVQGQYPGQHILTNPYLAAIPISEIDFGSNNNMDKVVYVYNTGSLQQYTTGGGATSRGENPGQYIAIPSEAAGAAGIPAEIAPMQGFLVRTASGVTASGRFKINYNQLAKNTAKQRAPKASESWLRLTLAAENSGDVMWLFAVDGTTPHYDNGWDGTKMVGDAGTPMLFSHNEAGNYQINAMEDIDGTDIAFRAGNADALYTITFNRGGDMLERYSKIYFEDKETGDIVDITEDGATYTFASSNQSITSRFRIATSPALQTGTYDVHIYTEGEKLYMNNISDTDSTIELIDLSGRNLTTYYCKAGEMKVVQLAVPRGCYVVRATTERVQSTKVVIK